ncbi:MAG: entry exclusion protein TrbK [Allorhizobium sp.]
MNRILVITLALLAAAASVSAVVIFVKSNETPAPSMTEDQRFPREKFFGSNKKLPAIEKGQEMRPRW